MPVFFQQQLDSHTRLGIWKIEEPDTFFQRNVPSHREVTHPHKRLQHLAGRFLLQYLFPGFPFEQVQIADTRKPYVPGEAYHFSISHCGDYAAALVSTENRVGVDVEIPVEQVQKVRKKFLAEEDEPACLQLRSALEHQVTPDAGLVASTLAWSIKEAVFKWYGEGRVDFREDIRLLAAHPGSQQVSCLFHKTGEELSVGYYIFSGLVATTVISS